jgi:hypothetical protein
MVVVLVAILGGSVWANQFCQAAKSRRTAARVRPDFVEAVEEQRRFRDYG